MSDKLRELRKQIDALDEVLIKTLAKRVDIVRLIGKYKNAQGIAPLDAKRWQKVLSSRLALAKRLGLDAEMVENIYEQIHIGALKIESEHLK